MIATTLKTSLLTTVSLMMFSHISYAEQYTDLHKQLNIMTKILTTAAKQEASKSSPKISTIESTYLKGQGVVFSIKTGSKFFNFSRFNFSMPQIPSLPHAPNIEGKFQGDIQEVVEDAMDVASQSWEIAVESMSEAREDSRQLRNEQRELNSQQRDIDRQLRDLHYQSTHADKNSSKELSTEVKQLTAQKNKLTLASKKLAAQAKKIKAKQQAEQKQLQLNQKKYYQSLAQLISETFCSYGNALKALPKNEKISVILAGAAQADGNKETKDKIYVFDKKAVLDCVVDKINAKTLLAKSVQYNF